MTVSTQGILYARTPHGEEIPILDITHEAFTNYCNEAVLEKKSAAAASKIGMISHMPGFLKTMIRKSSNTQNSYLSGMRTLALKLGPRLMKGMKVGFTERRLVHEFSSVALRIRVRNISILQAEALRPELERHPNKQLVMVNIAGGAAGDSINSLRLLAAANKELLSKRRIEIIVLDTDTFGPEFASSSIEVLKINDPLFFGLNLSVRHIRYDWNSTQALSELLESTKDAIHGFSSEGGLFEYGTDQAIQANLEAIARTSNSDARIVGSIMLDPDHINPMMVEMQKVTGTSTRFLGMDGLRSIVSKSGWEIESSKSDGSVYATFTLKHP